MVSQTATRWTTATARSQKHADSKEQAQDDQDAAGTTEKGADKSPKFVMGMKIEMAHGRTELFPVPLPVPQYRRDQNNQDQPDAGPKKQQPVSRYFPRNCKAAIVATLIDRRSDFNLNG